VPNPHDIEAFERTVADQWNDLAEVVEYVLDVSTEDAEEWLQDALLAVWKALRRGSLPEPVAHWRAYLIKAALNRGCAVLRKRARRQEVLFTDLEVDPETPFDAPAPSDPLQEREEAEQAARALDRVAVALEKLPPREREIVSLRFQEPYEVLCARLGLQRKTAQEMCSRAMKRLRRILGEAA